MRIVSGCTDETQQTLYAQRHEQEVVQKMSKRFHICFTPNYSNFVIPGQSYNILTNRLEYDIG